MKKILVIDDSPFYAKIMSDKLPKEEYEVLVAGDGEEGVQMVAKHDPDLILLDLAMPKLDGISFLKKVQADRGDFAIPVIIFTNNNDLDKVSEGVALGVQGYIVKSLETLETIVESVKDALRKAEEKKKDKK